MGNPYMQTDDTPKPTPIVEPAESWAFEKYVAIAALAIGLLGCFLPSTGGDWSLPIPVPPFVEPVVDPAATEGSWVVVVEQTEQRTVEQARLMRDTLYWDSLKLRGLKYRHYDYDAEDASNYRKLADSVGLPAVAIVGGKGDLVGKVLGKFKLGDKLELDKKVKEFTGR